MESAILAIILCWIIFVLYWIVSSFSQKPTAEKPISIGTFLAQLLFGIPFVVLVRPEWFHLDMRIVTDSLEISLLSIALGILGLAICMWARKTLSGNWSKNLDLKEGHELVRTGPYRWVRHPIYTGFLFLFLGTAFAVGKIGGFIGFGVLLVGCVLRIQQEEELLMKHFMEEYRTYKKRVKALIPYFI